MNPDQAHIEMPPLRGVASFFALSGVAVCLAVGGFSWLFCSFAGWGDGSTGNAVGEPLLVAVLLTVPFVVYFIASVIAAMSSRRRTRIVLAWIAHICFLYMSVLAVLVLISQFPLAFIACIIFLGILTKCWMTVLQKNVVEQGASSDR
ncbi:MAG: hypothetical protein H7A51_13450 [Akkermansiaceae bacterium]|nr:hypothetical protein [Akkermansiaceae bacterium]